MVVVRGERMRWCVGGTADRKIFFFVVKRSKDGQQCREARCTCCLACLLNLPHFTSRLVHSMPCVSMPANLSGQIHLLLSPPIGGVS